MVILASILLVVKATFDLSNVDLMDFKYFKYPKTTKKPFLFRHHGQLFSIRKIPDPPNSLDDAINRGKAVIKYLKNVALGNPEMSIKSELIIDPDLSRKLSRQFQQKHGRFGEKLVELLGAGASYRDLVAKGAVES